MDRIALIQYRTARKLRMKRLISELDYALMKLKIAQECRDRQIAEFVKKSEVLP